MRNRNKIAAFLYIILLVIPQIANCAIPTSEEMDNVCKNWLSLIVNNSGDWAGILNPEIISFEEIYSNDLWVGRCYKIAPDGFVIVPALKEMPPVKAYSDEGYLDIENSNGMSELIKDVLFEKLDMFRVKYGSMGVKQDESDPLFQAINLQKWDIYSQTTKQFNQTSNFASNAAFNSFGPLLTTSWHQGAPYNNLCPMGDGDRCVVGCVATAAAQILQFHKWPDHGLSSYSFDWNGDNSCGAGTAMVELSADFSDEYIYDQTPDAVAELSYEVGVAFDMDYGACGSAAFTEKAIDVMPQYFRYSPSIIELERSSYQAEFWYHLLKLNLNLRSPILYTIYSHAIVCDGWRELDGIMQYHFNYGWGGSRNAWYVVDNLYCNWSGCNYMVESMFLSILPQCPKPWVTGAWLSYSSAKNDELKNNSELVELNVSMSNFGGTSADIIEINAWSENPQIDFDKSSVSFNDVGSFDSVQTNLDNVFLMHLPMDYPATNDTFFFEMVSNGGSRYDTTVMEIMTGRVSVLLVDDDNGNDYEQYYTECLDVINKPFDIWVSNGSPETGLLISYHTVIWFTGDDRAEPLSADEISEIEAFLDIGGNLILTGQGIAEQLHIQYPDFLHNYLKSEYQSSDYLPILGCSNSRIFGDTTTVVIFGTGGANNQTNPDQISAINGGVNEINYYGSDYSGCVSYSDSYSLVFFSFGFEAITSVTEERLNREDAMLSIFEFFDYQRGDANGDRMVNVSDAVYWVNHIFRGGPQPVTFKAGDANCDGIANISDAVFLINNIFKGGPAPGETCQ